jgi:hypothetical protein
MEIIPVPGRDRERHSGTAENDTALRLSAVN